MKSAFTPEERARHKEILQRHARAKLGPWWIEEDENVWMLFALGSLNPHAHGYQIIKAPKHSKEYMEYWPETDDAEMLVHAYDDIGFLLEMIKRMTIQGGAHT